MQDKSVLVAVFVLTVLGVGKPVLAEDKEKNKPTRELLEFLGSYEDDKGKFLDPSELEKVQLPEEKSNERQRN